MKTRKVLYAEDGMVITDGNSVYGKMVMLASDRTEDEFYEITEEEYREILENDIPDDLL